MGLKRISMKRKFCCLRSWVYRLLATGIVVALWLQLTPGNLSHGLNGVCRVMTRCIYYVALTDKDTLWLSADKGMVTTFSGDSLVADTSFNSGFVVSGSGAVVTSASAISFAGDEICSDSLAKILTKEKDRLEILRENKREAARELDYYARTHSVVDDGYNEVMAYRVRNTRERIHVERQLELIGKALRHPMARARLQADFEIVINIVRKNENTVAEEYRYVSKMVARSGSLLLLQINEPSGWPQGIHIFDTGFLAFRGRPAAVLGSWEENGLPVVAPVDSISGLALTSLDGMPVTDARGRLVGVRANNQMVPLFALRRLNWNFKPFYGWLWDGMKTWTDYMLGCDDIPSAITTRMFKKAGRSREKAYLDCRGYGHLQFKDGSRYVGQLHDRIPDGVGQMTYGDGGVYIGYWLSGKRDGKGIMMDTLGYRYDGLWRSDTLSYGSWENSESVYSGNFNKTLQRHGDGWWLKKDGAYYSGTWSDGTRQGFGFAVGEGKMVRAGIWGNDKFRGEQMVYTADRVYGIDISRYQHEIAGRHYGIDWTKMRITGLGTASRKRIKGHIDYPVNFVYVKATEGVTVKNRYYAVDAAAARRHGIHLGAYHFFSTKTSGRQQAQFFLSVAKPKRGDLPPVLDVEPSDKQIESMGGSQRMFREIIDWMRLVKWRTGTAPVLYVSQSFVNKYMEEAPAELLQCQVWIARYGEYKPYTHLLYWQLAYDGRVAGVHGDVDVNVFNGTRLEFETYIRVNAIR